ncbi:MAG: helix-turn-helix transcriptional regulator [Pseudomonadota bacterium]
MASHQTKILSAARVYLNLKQSEVAAMTGVSENTISKMERGEAGSTDRTLRRIRQVYEDRGIVFTSHGFEYQPYKTAIFEDFLDVLDDVAQTLKKGEELLLHCADERRNTPEVTKSLNALRDCGIKIRMTCELGNETISGDKKNYRWIDPDLYAAGQVEIIYKDKYLFHFQDEGRNIFVMTKNRAKARTAAKQFEYNWARGKKSWEIDQTT